MVHVHVTNCQNLVVRQHPSLTSIHANCFYIVHGISLRHWEIHLNCTIATSCNQILLIEWKIQTVHSHHISKIYFHWPMYASITDRITENKWAQFTHTFWLKMQGNPCFIVLPMCNLYLTSSDPLDSTIINIVTWLSYVLLCYHSQAHVNLVKQDSPTLTMRLFEVLYQPQPVSHLCQLRCTMVNWSVSG